ncbi:uncharacterized protein N7498_003057 [Penicillium cinerascens]|uniref:Zn(2)-C6 fungal-type domain-containing protein n=1 Tax=Penicillium cinerascens TaxID=70096 RepID=A0A9W9TCJ6_9EURO|nr:uncharacterized protein N7498_003057 [Penicillium cinerascens]KAJ5216650.1 hypothetical protein N7498_003057 [Penicillium cinerascens]
MAAGISNDTLRSSCSSSSSVPHGSFVGFSRLIFATEDRSALREISDQEAALSRQKRPHHKSRNGCLSCKRRRVKCDESTPACTNCAKRRENCEWPSRLQRTMPSRSRSPSIETAISQRLLDSANPNLNLLHLKLFHHFACATRETLIFKEVWDEGLQLSFQHEYLMHSILFLAARHLSVLVPNDPRYSTAAIAHLSQASRLYRQALSERFTEANIDALLCTGILLYYDAWMNVDFVSMGTDSVGLSLEFAKDHLFTLSPGMSQIFLTAIPLMTRKPSTFINGVLHQPSRTVQEALTTFRLDASQYLYFFAQWYDTALDHRALTLPRLSQPGGADQSRRLTFEYRYEPTDDPLEAYMAVVCRLSNILAVLPDAREGSRSLLEDDPSLVDDVSRLFLTFPMLCHAPFIQMLRERDPRALLLMYHFYRAAKILLPEDKCWWAAKRADLLQRALKSVLVGETTEI